MSKITFKQVQAETKGKYWSDEISIEKLMIECHICPKCGKSLTYQGFANMTESRGYGVCEKCDYAKLFFNYLAPVADFTRKVCQAVKEVV